MTHKQLRSVWRPFVDREPPPVCDMRVVPCHVSARQKFEDARLNDAEKHLMASLKSVVEVST